ncbi:glycosyltransferase family 2 protein [bacterium]|jgi:hypothetical protein|nr:glycosyltransferase family 2 protein [bacterium]
MQTTGLKISGFSLVRNGVKFDYPFQESIRSLLPLVDEFVINVGKGEDSTLAKIQALTSEPGGNKIRIVESIWPLDDPEKKRGGLILSEQTNIALENCKGDWCIYLQADEVLHENDLEKIRHAIQSAHQDSTIEGLLFDYVHLYGSYDVVQESRGAYRREVRAFKRSAGVKSVGDAQSFRRLDGSKLKVVRSGARVFHYGWVRDPEAMKQKTFFFDQLYHGAPTADQARDGIPHTGENYRYKKFWGLRPFRGQHPQTMRQRISSKGWHWDLQNSPLEWHVGDLTKVALDLFERTTGHRLFEYRSYELVRGSR